MLKRWRKNLFLALLMGISLRACVLETVRSTDNAMSPVLSDGDVAILSKVHYGLRIPGSGAMLVEWSEIKRGDVVVLSGVGDPPVNLARRVTAIPGDKVLLPGEKERITLKRGFYYVSAEQENAVDSREIGAISRRAIVGKLTHIWLPADSNVKSGNTERTILQRVL